MSKASNMEKPDGSRMPTTVAEGWLRSICKSVVLSWSDFATQGTFGDIFGCHNVRVLLASSKKRSGMLLNIP